MVLVGAACRGRVRYCPDLGSVLALGGLGAVTLTLVFPLDQGPVGFPGDPGPPGEGGPRVSLTQGGEGAKRVGLAQRGSVKLMGLGVGKLGSGRAGRGTGGLGVLG